MTVHHQRQRIEGYSALCEDQQIVSGGLINGSRPTSLCEEGCRSRDGSGDAGITPNSSSLYDKISVTKLKVVQSLNRHFCD